MNYQSAQWSVDSHKKRERVLQHVRDHRGKLAAVLAWSMRGQTWTRYGISKDGETWERFGDNRLPLGPGCLERLELWYRDRRALEDVQAAFAHEFGGLCVGCGHIVDSDSACESDAPEVHH